MQLNNCEIKLLIKVFINSCKNLILLKKLRLLFSYSNNYIDKYVLFPFTLVIDSDRIHNEYKNDKKHSTQMKYKLGPTFCKNEIREMDFDFIVKYNKLLNWKNIFLTIEKNYENVKDYNITKNYFSNKEFLKNNIEGTCNQKGHEGVRNQTGHLLSESNLSRLLMYCVKLSKEHLTIFIKKYKFRKITKYQDLDENQLEYLIKNSKHVNWNYISQYQSLNISFIEKYKDLINWKKLCINENIVLELFFYEDFKYYTNWYNLTMKRQLSEDNIRYIFLDLDKISDANINYNVCIYQKLSSEFIIEFFNMLYLLPVYENQKSILNEDFISFIMTKDDFHFYDDSQFWYWSSISEIKLDYDFIEKYKDKLFWSSICENKKIKKDMNFITKYKHNFPKIKKHMRGVFKINNVKMTMNSYKNFVPINV